MRVPATANRGRRRNGGSVARRRRKSHAADETLLRARRSPNAAVRLRRGSV
jgi:hypothetical protein